MSAKIASLGVFGDNIPNHVLVNEYTPRQGIMVIICVIHKSVIYTGHFVTNYLRCRLGKLNSQFIVTACIDVQNFS